MNISPNFQAIKIGQADVGDLLFLRDALPPVLIVSDLGNSGSTMLLFVGAEGRVQDTNATLDSTVGLKVCDSWRFQLEPTIAGSVLSHPTNAENGQIVVSNDGRFFRSVFAASHMGEEALIDLDQSTVLAKAFDATGRSFPFNWELEIYLGGDRWGKLVNPLVTAATESD